MIKENKLNAQINKDMDIEPLGLYIHIPFCQSKCSYCDFLSFASYTQKQMILYTDALCLELELLNPDRNITSVFMGGGTPTILPFDCLMKIVKTTMKLPIEQNYEFTIEANPATITQRQLAELYQAGVNRISFGAQAMQDSLLKSIGRTHSSDDVLQALEWANKAGFKNINVDLMIGLPNQTMQDINESIELVENLVNHISVYTLILEERTLLHHQVEQGTVCLPDEDVVADMLDFCEKILEEKGFKQYEISNYAKENAFCKQNVLYWSCGEYLAAGLGASSAIKKDAYLYRMKNIENFEEYLQKISIGETVTFLEEKVDLKEQMFEYIMLGLRMNRGINLHQFQMRFGQSIESEYKEAIEKNVEKRWLVYIEGFLRLTKLGRRMQNILLLDFLEQ